MCGIFCVVQKQGGVNHSQKIKKAIDSIGYRGPDDRGTFMDERVAMGHCRLAVFDTSIAGKQPFDKENITLIFNGSIYNHPEIRHTLEQSGVQFDSTSDTEVILEAYRKWGPRSVEKFNGMWSFILYDRLQSKMIISRDRYGIKPLYSYEDSEQYIFASEQKAIFSYLNKKGTVNSHAVAKYLSYGLINDVSEETFYEETRAIRPATLHILDLQTGSYSQDAFYQLGQGINTSLDFYELLQDSIMLRSRSDVALGSCLSGGIDSSTIVSFLADNKDSISTHSIVYPKTTIDERPYINDLQSVYHFENHQYSPSIDELLTSLVEVMWHQEQPITHTSMLAQYYLFRQIKEHGLNVVLDGQGADELLYGYSIFQIRAIQNAQFGFADKWNTLHLLWQENRLSSIVAQGVNKLRKARNTVPSWLDLSVALPPAVEIDSLKKQSMYLFQRMGLPALLHYEDRNSMAHGIESRLPFLDHRLVEFSLQLNDTDKLKKGKRKALLHDAMKSKLPPSILQRRGKLGFETPQDQWAQTHKNEFENLFDLSYDHCASHGFVKKGRSGDLEQGQKWRIIFLSHWLQSV